MGIKKLFSKDKDKDKNRSSSSIKYDQKNSSTRSSISLSQSISKWTHKEKDKIKHGLSSTKEQQPSIDNTRDDSTNVENIPVRPSTDSYSTNHSYVPPENTNPFITATPPSSTPSLNEVNNVVRVLRKTDSKSSNENFKEKVHSDSIQEDDNNLPTPPDAANPSGNDQLESKNPFLTQSTPLWDVDDSPASKLYDSKKYEYPDIKEENEQTEEANKAPITNNNASKPVNKEDNDSLYSELLSVQKQLENATSTNDSDTKKRLDSINTQLNSALKKTVDLESRLTSVIQVSKQTILQKSDEIKQLEQESQTEKSTILSMTKELEDLKKTLNALQNDNNEIGTLLNNSQQGSEVKEGRLSHRLEAMIAASAASDTLNNQLKSQLEDSNAKAQNLQQEIETLNLKVMELEKLKGNENIIRDLQDKLSALEENTTGMQAQLQTNHDVIATLTQEKKEIQSRLEDSIKSLEQKLVDLQKSKDDMAELMEKENTELKTKVDQLTNENSLLEPLRLESDRLREQIQSLEVQISQESMSKKEREQTHSDSINERNTRIESLERERVSLLEQLTLQKTEEEAKLDSNAARISSLEQELHQAKQQIEIKEKEKNALEEEIKIKQESLVEENTRLSSQIQILKGSTSDEVQQVAENNRMLNEDLEKARDSIQVLQSQNDQLHKQLETTAIDAQQAVSLTAQVATLSKSLEAAKEDTKQLEDLKAQLDSVKAEMSNLKSSKDSSEKELQEQLQKNKEIFEISLKEANIESDKLTSELKLSKAKSDEAESEINRLKEELAGMMEMSKKAAQAVMDENERLEGQVQKIEENAHAISSENESLKEEIELLSKNTARRSLVSENQKMKNQLMTMTHLQEENKNLQELVECLQEKIKELSFEDPIQQTAHVASPSFKKEHADNSKTSTSQQQEELMLMHTRAQLGLIEYLEGEDNVSQAMARFKKQLEAEMKEFTNTPAEKSVLFDSSTDVSDSDLQPTQNEPIPSVSSSTSMR